MKTYHIVTFDHERAAWSLFEDLRSVGLVQDYEFHTNRRPNKSDGARITIPVPEGVDPDKHLTAVKNFSLGRGSHSVERVTK